MGISYKSSVDRFSLRVVAAFGLTVMIVGVLGMGLNSSAVASEANSDGAHASKIGNVKFQKRFKKKFLPVRKMLKTCNKRKIRKANRKLNRLKRQVPKLALNSQWKNGVSRWIARYAQAVAAHGLGKKAKAKRLALRSAKLYSRASVYAGENDVPLGGPGNNSSPSVDSMATGLNYLVKGWYICGSGY